MNHWLISIALKKLAEFWRPSLPDSVIVKSNVATTSLYGSFFALKFIDGKSEFQINRKMSLVISSSAAKTNKTAASRELHKFVKISNCFAPLLTNFLHFTPANFNFNLSIHS